MSKIYPGNYALRGSSSSSNLITSSMFNNYLVRHAAVGEVVGFDDQLEREEVEWHRDEDM